MTEPPRLVQIAEFDRPQGGSFVPMFTGLLRAGRDRGWRTTAVLPEAAGNTEWIEEIREVAEVELAPPQAQGTRRTRGDWLARTLHDGTAPTILHTHFTEWDVAALMASRHIDAEPAKVFWHVHSALPHDPLVVARSSVKFGLLGRGVAGIICPAPNIALGVEQRFGSPEKVHFMPSALDPGLYPLAGADRRAEARRELELDEDANVVLHFGWHPFLKGTDIFLEMMGELIASDDRSIGIVRGHKPESEALARDLGIADRIRFQTPVPDASSLFAAADVIVSSSREEGMAYTVLEALCSGTPVVASAIPGHAYIGERVDACRITSTDVGALARSTREVLDLPVDEGMRLGAEAHEWIVENLSVPAIATRVFALYDEALGVPERAVAQAPSASRSEVSRTPTVFAVADYANETPGSFIPMLHKGVQATMERGWRPEVVLPARAAGWPWAHQLEDSGARVRFAPDLGRDGTRRWLRSIADEAAGPAILHTHFTGYDLAAAFAARASEDAVVIWHVHSTLSKSPKIIARNYVKFGAIGRSVGAIICPAPEMAEGVVSRGAPSDKVSFIPNAIDLRRFKPVNREAKLAARRHLGIDGEGAVIVGFGWHWEVKGGDLFLGSVDAALRTTSVAGALLVTDDPRAEGAIATLGLTGIATPIAAVHDPRELYAAADVFIAASRAEGMPFAVLEALASGVPVVASDIRAHRYIAERVTGMTLAEREPEAFGSAIAAAAAGIAAPSVDPTFGLDRWGEQILEVYEQVLADRNGREKTQNGSDRS